MMIRNLLFLFVLVGISSASFGQQPYEWIQKDSVRVPVFKFDEFQKALKPTNDTTYVINFWATWCKPCVAELPAFEKLNKNYAHQKVKVLLVSIDGRKTAESSLLPFLIKKKYTSTVWLLNEPDFNSWLDKVSPAWSGSIPATLIIKGNKSQFFEQSFEYEHLVKQVSTFIE